MSKTTKKTKKPSAHAKEAKAAELKREPVPPAKPRGPVPTAVVMARHGDRLLQRDARGFSLGELDSSEITASEARNLGLRLDIRRRSIVAGNVEKLKGWKVPVGKAMKMEPKVPVEAKPTKQITPRKKKAQAPKKKAVRKV